MGTRNQAKNATAIAVWAAAQYGVGRGEPLKEVI